MQIIDNSSHSMYDRTTLWKMEWDLKIKQEKQMNETQEMKECSFAPRVLSSVEKFRIEANKVNVFNFVGVEEHIERQFIAKKQREEKAKYFERGETGGSYSHR